MIDVDTMERIDIEALAGMSRLVHGWLMKEDLSGGQIRGRLRRSAFREFVPKFGLWVVQEVIRELARRGSRVIRIVPGRLYSLRDS